MLRLDGKTPEQVRKEHSAEQTKKLIHGIFTHLQIGASAVLVSLAMNVLASRWPQVPAFGIVDTWLLILGAASVVWASRLVWDLGR